MILSCHSRQQSMFRHRLPRYLINITTPDVAATSHVARRAHREKGCYACRWRSIVAFHAREMMSVDHTVDAKPSSSIFGQARHSAVIGDAPRCTSFRHQCAYTPTCRPAAKVPAAYFICAQVTDSFSPPFSPKSRASAVHHRFPRWPTAAGRQAGRQEVADFRHRHFDFFDDACRLPVPTPGMMYDERERRAVSRSTRRPRRHISPSRRLHDFRGRAFSPSFFSQLSLHIFFSQSYRQAVTRYRWAMKIFTYTARRPRVRME